MRVTNKDFSLCWRLRLHFLDDGLEEIRSHVPRNKAHDEVWETVIAVENRVDVAYDGANDHVSETSIGFEALKVLRPHNHIRARTEETKNREAERFRNHASLSLNPSPLLWYPKLLCF